METNYKQDKENIPVVIFHPIVNNSFTEFVISFPIDSIPSIGGINYVEAYQDIKRKIRFLQLSCSIGNIADELISRGM